MTFFRRVIFAIIGLLALLVVLAAWFGSFAIIPFKSGSKETVVVEIGRGQSRNDVAKMLVARGIVEDASRFAWLCRLSGRWSHVKAGEYEVSPGMAPLEVLAVITSGVGLSHPITAREGENMFEVAADVVTKGLDPQGRFIKLCKDPAFLKTLGLGVPVPATVEGYLYPETYFFNKTLSAEDMIKQMVHKFFTIWGTEQIQRAKVLGLSRQTVVTLASMVEKETGSPEERPLIASVFFNRLEKKMRLQSDPTTIYGIWDRYHGKITKADLQESTPYNTYTIAGIPPGPIANPGKEAIAAVLHPAQSEYLFFVSHNDGTHQFSKSYGDHQAAVRTFQLDPKAREGKSWRDLHKRPEHVIPGGNTAN